MEEFFIFVFSSAPCYNVTDARTTRHDKWKRNANEKMMMAKQVSPNLRSLFFFSKLPTNTMQCCYTQYTAMAAIYFSSTMLYYLLNLWMLKINLKDGLNGASFLCCDCAHSNLFSSLSLQCNIRHCIEKNLTGIRWNRICMAQGRKMLNVTVKSHWKRANWLLGRTI